MQKTFHPLPQMPDNHGHLGRIEESVPTCAVSTLKELLERSYPGQFWNSDIDTGQVELEQATATSNDMGEADREFSIAAAEWANVQVRYK